MLIETITPRADTPDETYAQTTMRVRKRNGGSEPVDVNKIVRAVSRCCVGLRRRRRAARGDEDDQRPLRRRHHARAGPALHPDRRRRSSSRSREYARLAARLLATYIDKEVARPGDPRLLAVDRRGPPPRPGQRPPAATSCTTNARKLNDAIDADARPASSSTSACARSTTATCSSTRRRATVIETPQQFFLRIACALAETVPEALELYRLFSSLEYLPSSPTLFNAGTRHEQLSSCFLLDSPEDEPGEHLPALHGRRACSRSSRAASASPTTACARAAR